jgi:hypothetical protein
LCWNARQQTKASRPPGGLGVEVAEFHPRRARRAPARHIEHRLGDVRPDHPSRSAHAGGQLEGGLAAAATDVEDALAVHRRQDAHRL